MATIRDLVTIGIVAPLKLPDRSFRRHEFRMREIFCTPEFGAWLRGRVLNEEPFYEDSQPIKKQVFALLKSYESGSSFESPKLFKRMRPTKDDVYELRSTDIRFFGWFDRKDSFIAVSGNTFTNLKEDPTLYEKHRLEVISFRTNCDLDEPKHVIGTEDDVITN